MPPLKPAASAAHTAATAADTARSTHLQVSSVDRAPPPRQPDGHYASVWEAPSISKAPAAPRHEPTSARVSHRGLIDLPYVRKLSLPIAEADRQSMLKTLKGSTLSQLAEQGEALRWLMFAADYRNASESIEAVLSTAAARAAELTDWTSQRSIDDALKVFMSTHRKSLPEEWLSRLTQAVEAKVFNPMDLMHQISGPAVDHLVNGWERQLQSVLKRADLTALHDLVRSVPAFHLNYGGGDTIGHRMLQLRFRDPAFRWLGENLPRGDAAQFARFRAIAQDLSSVSATLAERYPELLNKDTLANALLFAVNDPSPENFAWVRGWFSRQTMVDAIDAYKGILYQESNKPKVKAIWTELCNEVLGPVTEELLARARDDGSLLKRVMEPIRFSRSLRTDWEWGDEKHWTQLLEYEGRVAFSPMEQALRTFIDTEVERASRLASPAAALWRVKELQGIGGWPHEWQDRRARALSQPFLPKEVLKWTTYPTYKFEEPPALLFAGAFPTARGELAELLPYVTGWHDTAPPGKKAWSWIRRAWEAVPSSLHTLLLEEALTRGLKNLERYGSRLGLGTMSSQERMKQLLKTSVLEPIKAEPGAAHLAERLERVFLSLELQDQIHVLATVFAGEPTTDPALLARRALRGLGVVGIKLGQELIDPRTPPNFVAAFDSLQDAGAAWRSRPAIWQDLREAGAEDRLLGLGKTYGVGSNRQALEAQTHEGARVLSVSDPTEMARTRRILKALEKDPEIGVLVEDLNSMLERELADMTHEPHVFKAFAESALGQSPLVSIPEVEAAYPNAIIRTLSEGKTHAELIREGPLTPDQLARKSEVHRLMVRTALDPRATPESRDGTLIFGDPKNGNSADDGTRVGLFDMMQYETLSTRQLDAFLQLLQHFIVRSLSEALPGWKVPSGFDNPEQLIQTLLTVSEPGRARGAKSRSLESSLREALAEAAPDAATAGSSSGVVDRMLAFLKGAKDHGVKVPSGFSGAVKMLNNLRSQEALLGMGDVTDREVAKILLERLDDSVRAQLPAGLFDE